MPGSAATQDGPDPGPSPELAGPPRQRFRDATLAARVLVVTATVAAVVLPAIAPYDAHIDAPLPEWLVALVIFGSSIVSVETGWIIEGRTRLEQRPHKALSLWAFATATGVGVWWLLAIVPLTYAHVYWRGLRPPWWKWVGSAAFVIISAVAASQVLAVAQHPMSLDSGGETLAVLLLAMVTFVACEAVLFLAMSRINHAAQEAWLRATLATASFYLTELGLIAVAGLSVLVLAESPWAALLLLPVYGFVQEAVVFQPLRVEATTDGKTGLMRYEAWRALCAAERDRMARDGRPWAILFLDLDHFGRYNETHGHLGGDQALVTVADVLRRHTRKRDLLCRFGGEEFAVFMAESTRTEAAFAGERLRVAVEQAAPGAGEDTAVTVSVGVAAVSDLPPEGEDPPELGVALSHADRALYEAKSSGRNRVVVHTLGA